MSGELQPVWYNQRHIEDTQHPCCCSLSVSHPPNVGYKPTKDLQCACSTLKCHTWWTHLVVPLQRQGWTQAATGSSSSLAKQTQHWRSSSPPPPPVQWRSVQKILRISLTVSLLFNNPTVLIVRQLITAIAPQSFCIAQTNFFVLKPWPKQAFFLTILIFFFSSFICRRPLWWVIISLIRFFPLESDSTPWSNTQYQGLKIIQRLLKIDWIAKKEGSRHEISFYNEPRPNNL